jgi:hypothetical protein
MGVWFGLSAVLNMVEENNTIFPAKNRSWLQMNSRHGFETCMAVAYMRRNRSNTTVLAHKGKLAPCASRMADTGM